MAEPVAAAVDEPHELIQLIEAVASAPAQRDFARSAWGHRGYDPEVVDAFVVTLQERLDAGRSEIGDLRRELDRLHRYIRREWAEGARAGGAPTGPVSLSRAQDVASERLAEADRRLLESQALAVRKLEESQAQAAATVQEAQRRAGDLIAEAEAQAAQRLAAAESMAEQTLSRAWKESGQSRRRADAAATQALVSVRNRYQDIVVRAHQRAEQAAANALHQLEQHASESDDAGRARADLQLRAAYLRTSAEVSRAAMRAALTFADQEFDQLAGAEDDPRDRSPW